MKTTHPFVLFGVTALLLSSHQHTCSVVAAGVTHTGKGFQCPHFTHVQTCDLEKDQEEQKCTYELLNHQLSDGKEKVIKHTCSLPSKRTQCRDFNEENDCLNAQCSWTSIVAQPSKGAHSTGRKIEKSFCDKEVVCTAFKNREACEQEPHCKWDKGGVSTSGVKLLAGCLRRMPGDRGEEDEQEEQENEIILNATKDMFGHGREEA
ncbi:hypothetical protein K492DRAFT_236810 [Lichtheimia hyalospora FSU 10163]|nr:hypothetical protein K492DRAFT_236810 [Lichtheimia hyalospora FSU 10163]